MLPKTEIRYSIIYNKLFNENFTFEDRNKIIENSRKFEELHKKYINEILKLIEKYGFKWRKEYIPIYIAKDTKISFSDPLTLKYRDNERLMLVILIHELLHNNLEGNKKFNTRNELHVFMRPIVEKIVLELPINLKAELRQFNDFS